VRFSFCVRLHGQQFGGENPGVATLRTISQEQKDGRKEVESEES